MGNQAAWLMEAIPGGQLRCAFNHMPMTFMQATAKFHSDILTVAPATCAFHEKRLPRRKPLKDTNVPWLHGHMSKPILPTTVSTTFA